jgi:diaminopimelate decarboxylase
MPILSSGDMLVLCDAGAYGYSMGSNYNLRGRPQEILIDKNKKPKIINQAQKYQDLL